jgi:RNA polymerase sigma-70 factor, ECF subfamily
MHEEYLRRIRAGADAEALACLFELDQAGIYRFMLRRLGHRQDAEDATQELFRRVLTSLHSLRDPKGYRGWLYRIALRVAQAQAQSQIGERRRVEALARTAPATGSSMTQPDSPERREQIKTALKTLEEDLRTVVLLRYEQGLSYEEIAEATQRPVGTVSKRLHTAHQKLQQALAAVGASAAMAALGDAFAAPTAEALPAGLAARLRQMALEAELRPVRVLTAKAGAMAAAGILAVLFLGTSLVRRMTVAPSDPVPDSGKEVSVRGSSARPSPTPLPKGTPAAVAGEDRPPAASAILRGRVIDRETRAAVGGADLWLISGDDDLEKAIRTTTTPDGSFRFQVPAGTYSLDAIAPGFTRFKTERMLEAQRLNAFAEEESESKEAEEAIRSCYHLELKSGSELERTVELLASAELRGLVVDRRGYPVPNAQVFLKDLSTTYSGKSSEYKFTTTYEPDGKTSKFVTDLQGRFAIRHVYPNGSLDLAVTCPGFRSLEETVALRQGDLDLTLVLDRGVSYGGRVQAQGGQPIANACLYLLGAPTRPTSDELFTGSRGEFQAADQHGGATHVLAFASGYGPRLVALSGQDPLQVPITLTRAESPVTGVVTDDAGQPVEGVAVSVHSYELTAGDLVAQLGFQGKFSSWSLGGPAGMVANFLPESFTPPNTSSQGDGAFRLEGVALTAENVTTLQLVKEGYEREEIKVSGAVPTQVTLRRQKK